MQNLSGYKVFCFHIFQLRIDYLEYLQLFQQHLLHSVCVFVVDGDNFQHHWVIWWKEEALGVNGTVLLE